MLGAISAVTISVASRRSRSSPILSVLTMYAFGRLLSRALSGSSFVPALIRFGVRTSILERALWI